MAARAISSGTISFGLVSIPIKVYTANGSKTVRFSMLHETDKGRLKQTYTCRSCEEPVGRGATVKGYEYARDQYVVITDDELAAIESRSDRTIEIEEFVPIAKVDPIYYEKSNLLGPDKGGSKAYQLLRDAMLESGKVAVGRFNTRGREQLVLIRPTARGLVLHGLFYADEVRSFEDVDLGDPAALKGGELELAQQLIEQLSRESFEPGRYEDRYRQELLAQIDRKVAGEEIVTSPAAEPREKIIDLVAALKESLAERAEAAPGPRKAKRTTRKKSTKKQTSTG